VGCAYVFISFSPACHKKSKQILRNDVFCVDLFSVLADFGVVSLWLTVELIQCLLRQTQMFLCSGFGFPFTTPLKFLTVQNVDTPEASYFSSPIGI